MHFRKHCLVIAVGWLGGSLGVSCSEERSYPGPQAGAAGEGAGEGGEGGANSAVPAGGAESGGAGPSGAGQGGEPQSGGSGTGIEEPPLCEPTAAPARLLAPLSSSLVSNRRPTLSWELGDDCGPLTVEVCADRDRKSVV